LDCHQSLTQLARYNKVQLIWVPGHEGIVGNEMADQLARMGSEHPFIGPEPACGISVGVAKRAVRDWTNRNRKEYSDASCCVLVLYIGLYLPSNTTTNISIHSLTYRCASLNEDYQSIKQNQRTNY
jgi:hypothetical protein